MAWRAGVILFIFIVMLRHSSQPRDEVRWRVMASTFQICDHRAVPVAATVRDRND
jgi:hypothetical protein